MRFWKRAVLSTVAALACAGVYGAVRNLPVVSGCNFYNQCPGDVEIAAAAHARSAVKGVNGSDQHD